jgi:hypothetical protein
MWRYPLVLRRTPAVLRTLVGSATRVLLTWSQYGKRRRLFCNSFDVAWVFLNATNLLVFLCEHARLTCYNDFGCLLRIFVKCCNDATIAYFFFYQVSGEVSPDIFVVFSLLIVVEPYKQIQFFFTLMKHLRDWERGLDKLKKHKIFAKMIFLLQLRFCGIGSLETLPKINIE